MRRAIAALVGLVLATLCALPSHATIFAVGSEDTSFTATGTASGQATILSGRTAFENASVSVAASASTPPANRFAPPSFSATSTLWFHAFIQSGSVTTANGDWMWWASSPDNVPRLLLRQTATSGVFKLSTDNGVGTITDLGTSTFTLVASTSYQLDINVNYTCSAAGSVTVYINGSAVISFSGNPCTDAATTLNQVAFSAFCNQTASNTNNLWSEVIVADQDTRGMALVALPPQAAGATQSWTPNTLANIAKQIINDATFISAAASSTKSEWTLPTTLPAGNFAILGVAQEARVQVGTSGPQHYEWLLHIAGSDFVTGSVAPLTSFGNNQTIWTTNPNTGTGWAPSDITAGIQAGIESTP